MHLQASMKFMQSKTFRLILRILQLNQAMATLSLHNFGTQSCAKMSLLLYISLSYLTHDYV